MSVFFFLALPAVLIFVLRARPPFALYFHAQIVFNLLVWGVLACQVSPYSLFYTLVFSLATVLVLAAAFWGVHEGLATNRYRSRVWLTGLMCGLIAGMLAYCNMPHPLNLPKWIALLEGTFLIVLGFGAGQATEGITANCSLVAGILSVFWYVQALFQFGFSMHLPSPKWLALDDWFPGLLGLGVFAIIGTLLRIPDVQQPRLRVVSLRR